MKRFVIAVSVVLSLVCLPFLVLIVSEPYDHWRESRNYFSIADACKIKKGMDIEQAKTLLHRPYFYQNYNWSNAFSAQYRDLKRNYFIEIIYTTDNDKVVEVYWGRGRTQTLAQSGVCGR